MLRIMCKSKIHRATVTDANLRYIGSITIDKKLLEAADMYPNERVQVVNLNNGTRVETYIMEGKSGSGVVCMNGAAARWAQAGDPVIIISYCLLESQEAKDWKQKVVFVDDHNRIVTRKADVQKQKSKRR
ncbi:MAG: aspartate 1-decarboxylase [Candidatus Omnitrophica bacterium]|nr:aspartate 1-decarboxylase [Candidatus Omnitrophota bacterium]MBU4477978.1 aspartate 1-decarboxylase [Candidatus Omnitrophota bacterium]MCG2703386.1 aspartate 1-decarboxylase [Candidatus Omnitrophota bacterium]